MKIVMGHVGIIANNKKEAVDAIKYLVKTNKLKFGTLLAITMPCCGECKKYKTYKDIPDLSQRHWCFRQFWLMIKSFFTNRPIVLSYWFIKYRDNKNDK